MRAALYDKAGAMAAMVRLHQDGDSPPAHMQPVLPPPQAEQDDADSDRFVSLLRIAGIIVLTCQVAYLLLDLNARGWAMARLPLALHLTNVTVAALILGTVTALGQY